MEEEREEGTREGVEMGEKEGVEANEEEVREEHKEREEEEEREKGKEEMREWVEGLRNMPDEEQAEYLRQWLESKERERERLNNAIRCLRKELMMVTLRIQKRQEEWERKERELGVDEFGNIRLENAKPHNQECFYSLNNELI